jgi:hypothetical protein
MSNRENRGRRGGAKTSQKSGGQNFFGWLGSVPGQIMRQDFGVPKSGGAPVKNPSSVNVGRPVGQSGYKQGPPQGPYLPVTVDELIGSMSVADSGGYEGETAPAGGFSLADMFGIGSGGGGGGASARQQYELEQAQAQQRALNRYARAIRGRLDDDSYRSAQDDLLAKLGEQYGAATPVINQSIDALRGLIESQQNPYAGLQAQVSEVSPQLAQLMESQGLSTDALGQFASVLGSQAQERGNAYNEMVARMASAEDAARQRMLAGAESQRTNLLAGLEGSRAGLASQIEAQAVGERNRLEELMLQAIAQGANVGGKKKSKKKGKK